MLSVTTLTLNPAIDADLIAPHVRPTHKIRTSNAVFTPGGGGINVARLLTALGTPARALYLAGGTTGDIFETVMAGEHLESTRIPVAGRTRISVTVYDRAQQLEYRFVPEGPTIREAEWRACLDAVTAMAPDILVASGSLPPGIPDDFYARLLRALARTETRVVLDTSGTPLAKSIGEGGVFLLTPSKSELERFAGRPLPDTGAVTREAQRIVAQGGAQCIAVTLGSEGAILVSDDGPEYRPALPVHAISAVGAGDSFLAGMIHGLRKGWPLGEAFHLAMAAGAAAVTTPRGAPIASETVLQLLELSRTTTSAKTSHA